MSKSTKPKGKDNSMKILYWMGAGVVVLLLGVVALAMLNKPKPRVMADPERTLLWFYDARNPGGTVAAAILEESRSEARLAVVPFTPAAEMRAAQQGKGGRAVVTAVAAAVDRKIHHRFVVPFHIISTLIDAAGGVDVDDRRMTGPQALQYVEAGGEKDAPRRMALVMLALPDAIAARGVNMGLREGLRLANEIDSSIDLTALPDVMARWNGYGQIRVESPPDSSPATLQKYLKPDPEPEAAPK